LIQIRPSGGLVEVGVQHRSGFDLAARHQVPVAVEGNRDRCVAEVRAQGLGVQPGSDADAGEGVATLVETDREGGRQPPSGVGRSAPLTAALAVLFGG